MIEMLWNILLFIACAVGFVTMIVAFVIILMIAMGDKK
jgi:hypothetical protein